MKLSEYLKLNPNDLKIQETLLKMIPESKIELSDRQKQDLYEAVVNLSSRSIIKLVIVNPQLNQFFQMKLFDDYWQELCAQYGINDHINLPIVTISCLDLVKDMFIYHGYQKMLKKEKKNENLYLEAKEFLETSEKFGSFLALNALCINGLRLLEHGENIELCKNIFKRILNYANKAADLYWAPGYYLYANICQELTLYVDKLYGKNNAIMVKEILFNSAMEALIVFDKLHKYSETRIDIVYQGKNLQAAMRGQFRSFEGAREEKLLLCSKGYINPRDIEKHYLNADMVVNKIISHYKLGEELPDFVSSVASSPSYRKN